MWWFQVLCPLQSSQHYTHTLQKNVPIRYSFLSWVNWSNVYYALLKDTTYWHSRGLDSRLLYPETAILPTMCYVVCVIRNSFCEAFLLCILLTECHKIAMLYYVIACVCIWLNSSFLRQILRSYCLLLFTFSFLNSIYKVTCTWKTSVCVRMWKNITMVSIWK